MGTGKPFIHSLNKHPARTQWLMRRTQGTPFPPCSPKSLTGQLKVCTPPLGLPGGLVMLWGKGTTPHRNRNGPAPFIWKVTCLQKRWEKVKWSEQPQGDTTVAGAPTQSPLPSEGPSGSGGHPVLGSAGPGCFGGRGCRVLSLGPALLAFSRSQSGSGRGPPPKALLPPHIGRPPPAPPRAHLWLHFAS